MTEADADLWDANQPLFERKWSGGELVELMIPIQNHDKVPMYEQIYVFLKDEIRRGNLREAVRLPSTRVLAQHLKVSRSTTQMAYDQLLSEGYIQSVPYKGYFVADIEGMMQTQTELERCARKSDQVSGRLKPEDAFTSQTSGEKGASLAGDIIDFSPRGIDLDHFPYNTWRKITKHTLGEDNRSLFLSGHAQGEPLLREAVRDYLHSARGVICRSSQIIVGAGSEYMWMLLCQLLGNDQKIAMETPTYKQAYRVFESLGHQVMPVAMDSFGMSVEKLEKSGAEIAYVMPSHQYPMGIVMPVKRRQELLDWAAQKEGRYLIEDDYDSEFRYKGKPVPALQGMDQRGKVIYFGTFSKSVAPAIRISYMVLPESLMEIYQKKAGFYASTVSRIDQNILYRFLVEGHYERHLNRMRAVYKAKHDCLMAALKQLEPAFEIRGEYAGLHVLLTSRQKKTEEWLVTQALQAGVKVYGLSSCILEPEQAEGPGTVLLGYANLSEEEIVTGVGLLLQTWI